MSTPTTHTEIVKRPLPPGWRWVKLGEVCEIIAGQSPPSETYRKTPEGLPFFQGKADFGLAHPVPHTWCIAPKTIAELGDILISVRAPVGPTNIADVKCCIGRGLAALRPSIGIDRDFILFTLKFFEPELIKLGSGSTFQAIRREELERLGIPLPPLDEQRRIAAILREQMDAVERARRAAEEQLEAANALPAAYLRRVFPRHGDPLPPSWRWVKLGEVCEQDRIIVEPDSPLSERLTYLSLEHIDSDTGRILKEPVERTENEGKSTTFAFDGRHVLYGKLRPYLNKVALPEFPGRCTTEIIPLLPSKGVDREFLFWLLRRPETVEGAMQYKTGSRMPRADINELMKLVVPLPPLAEQRRIAAILREQMDAVERLRRTLEEQLEAINKLPAAILRKAFNGEL